MDEKTIPGVDRYGGAASGRDAPGAVAGAVRRQRGVTRESRAIRRMNEPTGFDCPGCAWADPKHTSSFEFCENGTHTMPYTAATFEAMRKPDLVVHIATKLVSVRLRPAEQAMAHEG
jgi:anaerobic selenocysteine-containing dehydrogenase